eukprot:2118184-Pleurochrysis_carterae.AAC.2
MNTSAFAHVHARACAPHMLDASDRTDLSAIVMCSSRRELRESASARERASVGAYACACMRQRRARLCGAAFALTGPSSWICVSSSALVRPLVCVFQDGVPLARPRVRVNEPERTHVCMNVCAPMWAIEERVAGRVSERGRKSRKRDGRFSRDWERKRENRARKIRSALRQGENEGGRERERGNRRGREGEKGRKRKTKEERVSTKQEAENARGQEKQRFEKERGMKKQGEYGEARRSVLWTWVRSESARRRERSEGRSGVNWSVHERVRVVNRCVTLRRVK